MRNRSQGSPAPAPVRLTRTVVCDEAVHRDALRAALTLRLVWRLIAMMGGFLGAGLLLAVLGRGWILLVIGVVMPLTWLAYPAYLKRKVRTLLAPGSAWSAGWEPGRLRIVSPDWDLTFGADGGFEPCLRRGRALILRPRTEEWFPVPAELVSDAELADLGIRTVGDGEPPLSDRAPSADPTLFVPVDRGVTLGRWAVHRLTLARGGVWQVLVPLIYLGGFYAVRDVGFLVIAIALPLFFVLGAGRRQRPVLRAGTRWNAGFVQGTLRVVRPGLDASFRPGSIRRIRRKAGFWEYRLGFHDGWVAVPQELITQAEVNWIGPCAR